MNSLNMELTIKATLAQKKSEMEKLEKSKKSHLRMITSSGAKFKLKYSKPEELSQLFGEPEAKNIRMYETHVPGFCYLRNGEYRRGTTNNVARSSKDPVQCSENIKSILFTDNELDIYKTICLHLLGTQVQTRNHIQRKDGRLCSYVKAQISGNTAHTLQAYTQRTGIQSNKFSSKYDKMLPRYILDVKVLNTKLSNSSLRTIEFDNGTDEETKRNRKLHVPIYINNEIRTIIYSVMEALEEVNSSKFKKLIELACSPEELKNLLNNEDMQEYIMELSSNSLIMTPTSYDFVIAHLMFDRSTASIPEKGTLESVAQVLEVCDNFELYHSISQIRKALMQRHTELITANSLSVKKNRNLEKTFTDTLKPSTPSLTSSLKSIPINKITIGRKDFNPEIIVLKNEESENKTNEDVISEKENKKEKKASFATKDVTQSVSINSEKLPEDHEYLKEISEDDSSYDESRGRDYSKNRPSSLDANKYSFQNLSNAQRILIGLKVASIKSKPLNVQQFDGKKRIDIGAIVAPILRPDQHNIEYKNLPESVSTLPAEERKERKLSSTASPTQRNKLENLTRAQLTNLRLEISEAENKKRVYQFMSTLT